MAIFHQQSKSDIIHAMTASRFSPRTVALKGIGAIVAFAGFFGLYYGTVMSFLVPGDPGESFFTVWRLTYGVLALLTGFLLLVFSARIWKQSSKQL